MNVILTTETANTIIILFKKKIKTKIFRNCKNISFKRQLILTLHISK